MECNSNLNSVHPAFTLAELTDCTAQLHDLSQIKPNTYLHKDRTGRFIPTAQGWSLQPGVQTAANWYKGHDVKKLAADLNAFHAGFGSTTDKVIATSCLMHEAAALPLIQERIVAAVGSKEKGGLESIKETYKAVEDVAAAAEGLLTTLRVKHSAIEAVIHENGMKQSLPTEILEVDSAKLRPGSVGLGKYLLGYTTALYYSHVRCLTGDWNWHDKIGNFESGKLYLGVLPSQSYWQDTLTYMKAEGITDVLSVTEVFENHSAGILLCPISPDVFSKAGISQCQLEAPDFGTLSMELLERGVEYLHTKLERGRSVYVHCKAGRGRSALIVMCYLIKHAGKTADAAFNLVKSQRKQAGFSTTDPKWASLMAYEAKYAQRA